MATGNLVRSYAINDEPPHRGWLLRAYASSAINKTGRLVRAFASVPPPLIISISGDDAGGKPATRSPGEMVPLQALGTSAVDSWVWTCSNPSVIITGGPSVFYYTAPGTREGTTLTFTVGAVRSGLPTIFETTDHPILAHAAGWYYDSSGVLRAYVSGADAGPTGPAVQNFGAGVYGDGIYG